MYAPALTPAAGPAAPPVLKPRFRPQAGIHASFHELTELRELCYWLGIGRVGERTHAAIYGWQDFGALLIPEAEELIASLQGHLEREAESPGGLVEPPKSRFWRGPS